LSQASNSLRFALFVALVCAATATMAQHSKTWPREWLEAEGEFGVLVIEYWLTSECKVAPGIEIVEHPNIEVTIEEIIVAMMPFLKQAIRPEIPKDAFTTASLEVFGQETFPDRTLEKSEYDALFAVLERLGPWPETQLMPLGGNTYKCTFDKHGLLTNVEKLSEDGEGYTDFEGRLAEQGPFRLRWEVED